MIALDREGRQTTAVITPVLVEFVVRAYRLPLAGIHGPGHWLRVLANGRALAAVTPGADAAVVELFALLHDSCRIRESGDPEHGARAADFVHSLADSGRLPLSGSQTILLAAACARHEKGEVSAHPTMGCCWDADRLDLSRLQRRPIAALLSTVAALAPLLQAAAWRRGTAELIDVGLAAEWGLKPELLR